MPILRGCFLACWRIGDDCVIKILDYSNSVLTDEFPHVWQYGRTLEELHLSSTRVCFVTIYIHSPYFFLINNHLLANYFTDIMSTIGIILLPEFNCASSQ